MPGSRPAAATAASRSRSGRTRSRALDVQSPGSSAARCAVTLVAGVALEMSGNTLADRAGVNGVIFGATVLAAATALPEISSGIAAVRLGDNALAIGDIFGGNAFQVCLFLLADLIAGTPVLPTAGRLNSWLASLGVALTAIYAIGVVGGRSAASPGSGPTRSSPRRVRARHRRASSSCPPTSEPCASPAPGPASGCRVTSEPPPCSRAALPSGRSAPLPPAPARRGRPRPSASA